MAATAASQARLSLKSGAHIDYNAYTRTFSVTDVAGDVHLYQGPQAIRLLNQDRRTLNLQATGQEQQALVKFIIDSPELTAQAHAQARGYNQRGPVKFGPDHFWAGAPDFMNVDEGRLALTLDVDPLTTLEGSAALETELPAGYYEDNNRAEFDNTQVGFRIRRKF